MSIKSFFLNASLLLLSLTNSAQVITTYAGVWGGLMCDGTTDGATFNNPTSICKDLAGNIYIADFGNHRIRKMTPLGVVTTVAGSVQGYLDGIGTAAKFYRPTGICIDNSGNLYVADAANFKIRKIDTNGNVTTLAGSTFGYADGTGIAAKFNGLSGLCCDVNGNIFVADKANHRIRKITPSGVVTTFAGSISGYLDANGTAAMFYNPTGICITTSGDFYITDSGNHRIRKITSSGTVTTLAGSGAADFADGVGNTASFSTPTGVCVDATNNVYVADMINNLIRKITPSGVVTTLAGSTTGFVHIIGQVTNFTHPNGVCFDATGNIIVADMDGHRIWKILGTNTNTVINMAGSTPGSKDGTGTPIAMDSRKVCSDFEGNIYATESGYNRIRKITPSGIVTSYVGNTDGTNNGTIATAQFGYPEDLCFDTSTGNIYVADTGNHRIRKITPTGIVSTLAGSTSGFADGTSAKFWGPKAVCTDPAGNIYVADTFNFRVRKITPNGVVSTLAGYNEGAANGTGLAARFSTMLGICSDINGNLYVADLGNFRIRKVTQAGVVTTLAGSVQGDIDGVGTAAQFTWPYGVAMGPDGNIYVADNTKIKRITPSGVVTTITGFVAGDLDGILFEPTGLCFDSNNDMFIADDGNGKVKKITQLPLGIQNHTQSDLMVKLYPNPTQTTVNIAVDLISETTEMSIIDISGKTIKRQKIITPITTLDMGNYENGIYFLTVTIGNETTTKKVIKY